MKISSPIPTTDLPNTSSRTKEAYRELYQSIDNVTAEQGFTCEFDNAEEFRLNRNAAKRYITKFSKSVKVISKSNLVFALRWKE